MKELNFSKQLFFEDNVHYRSVDTDKDEFINIGKEDSDARSSIRNQEECSESSPERTNHRSNSSTIAESDNNKTAAGKQLKWAPSTPSQFFKNTQLSLSDDESQYSSLDTSASQSERPLTVIEAMSTSQFWLIYAMAFMSVFQGYYTLNVYKAFGYTATQLSDDAFLTKVGSIAALMGAMRFAWSAAMDLDKATFKMVYGSLLVLQIVLGSTI